MEIQTLAAHPNNSIHRPCRRHNRLQRIEIALVTATNHKQSRSSSEAQTRSCSKRTDSRSILNRMLISAQIRRLTNLKRRGWQGWIGNNDNSGEKSAASNRNPFLLRKRPHALSSMLSSDNSTDLFSEWPSHEHASILWHAFINRVEPFVRITFRWIRDSLRTRSMDVELRQQLSKPENALVSAIFYISVSSLADEECRNSLQQSRSSLLSQYQAICEESLLRTNLLCMNEIVVMKAIIFYMVRKSCSAADFRS